MQGRIIKGIAGFYYIQTETITNRLSYDDDTSDDEAADEE